jgi:hypothetical protein
VADAAPLVSRRSENAVKAKFAEYSFQVLRWIRVKGRSGAY